MTIKDYPDCVAPVVLPGTDGNDSNMPVGGYKIAQQAAYDALYAFDAENKVEPASVIAERIAAKYGFDDKHSLVDDIHYAIEDALDLGQRRGKLIPVTDSRPFYGAECASYPNCSGGCGLGCTKEIAVCPVHR